MFSMSSIKNIYIAEIFNNILSIHSFNYSSRIQVTVIALKTMTLISSVIPLPACKYSFPPSPSP